MTIAHLKIKNSRSIRPSNPRWGGIFIFFPLKIKKNILLTVQYSNIVLFFLQEKKNAECIAQVQRQFQQKIENMENAWKRKTQQTLQTLDKRHQTLDIRHQILDIRNQTLDIRHQTLNIRHQTLDIRHQTLDIDTRHQTSDQT